MGTKFVEMERRYSELRNEYGKRSLSREQFELEVNKLRLQDDQMTWWQVNIEDGTWLRWDGASWITADPMAPRSPLPARTGEPGPDEVPIEPVSSVGFLKQFVKGMGMSLKKGLPWMILTAGMIFFIQMLILLVVKPGQGNWAGSLPGKLLVMQGNIIEGMVFWALLAWLVATVIGYLRSRTFESPVNRITDASRRIGDAIHDSGPLFLPVFIIGLLSALLIGAGLNNGVIAFQLTLVSSAWLMAQGGSGMVLFVGLLYRDIAGPRTPASTKGEAKDHYITTGLFGLAFGFFISIFAQFTPYVVAIILVLVFVIVLALLISRRVTHHG
ncbi:MAG: hypothetical protein WCK53_15865 [Methanomicrobiales archaeon]